MFAQPNAAKKIIPISTSLSHGPDAGAGGFQEHSFQDESIVKRHILIVDADPRVRWKISGILSDLHHELVEAASTEDAFQALSNHSIDLILVDLKAPEMGGIAFCQAVRKAQATRLIPIFIQASFAGLSAAEQVEQEMRAIAGGADEFLVAPFRPAALRARVHASLRHKSMLESLGDSESVLFSLAKSVEERDPDLGQHCQRLALMAAAVGVALGLSPAQVLALQQGGYLHDIGKISIPDRVLFKAGPLTPDEWEIMKSHAERGERMCAGVKSLAHALPIIRHHHEKFDGSGYPDKLREEEIPLLARVLQIADIYDALTTERPYKRGYPPDEALAIMREETQRGWRDPFLLEVFADLLPMFRPQSGAESARLSLQALAASLEHYRKNSLRSPAPPAGNFNPVQSIR